MAKELLQGGQLF